MRRIILWLLAVLLVLVIAAGLRLFLPISTAPFSGAPNSIAVVEHWPINGIAQTVIIRSRDTSNPILIWLHGGPGSAETPVLRRFNAPLEDKFTVVYWDQRYAGQSYDPAAPLPENLKIADYVSDLGVLVDGLRKRFHRQKVVLVGQSWGTVLGVLYARQHPENVSVYVGIGQVTNTPENERLSYVFALGEARRRGDAAAIQQLKALGPPPRAGSVFTPRDLLEKFGGFSRAGLGLGRLVSLSVTARETNWRDVAALFGAHKYSEAMLNGEFSHLVLDAGHPAFQVPVFILAGRYDQISVASLAHRFFERLTAPRKEFVWYENSAHNVNFDEPDRFNAFMLQEIRPLASAK